MNTKKIYKNLINTNKKIVVKCKIYLYKTKEIKFFIISDVTIFNDNKLLDVAIMQRY